MRIDVSYELHVKRYRDGVKLVRPDKNAHYPTVAALLQKKFNVYFLDAEHYIRAINEASWNSCGFNSERDAVGSTMARVCQHRHELHGLYAHEHNVITSGKSGSYAQYATLTNDKYLNAISTLMPWYNDADTIVGTFGCSVVLNARSVTEVADTIAEVNNLWSSHELIFSARELDVLKLIVRGKTTRAVADELKLSPRTIEYYLENIKVKANVASKSELIEKYYDSL